MRLGNDIIEDVIAEVAGVDVIPLVKVLRNKKNVSEFKLADAIKQEVNATRNMLYRLHNANLVTFIRKKDKKKGWYIYYWTFDMKRVKYLMSEIKKKRLKRLKERLEREREGQFFICQNKCIRLDFDQAMNFEFKCPECGSIIQQDDNSELIEKIKKEIAELENELKEGKKPVRKAKIKKKTRRKLEEKIKVKKKVKKKR